MSLTLELKPTVIFVSYGTNESFEGEAGLPKFEKGLEKLLDALKPANARVVLFTPAAGSRQRPPPDADSGATEHVAQALSVRRFERRRRDAAHCLRRLSIQPGEESDNSRSTEAEGYEA